MFTIEPKRLLGLTEAVNAQAAEALLASALARVRQIAPCLDDSTDIDKIDAATAIVLDALVRRAEGGSGAVTQQTAGPFSQTISGSTVLNLFTTQERADLARLCGRPQQAYTVDMAPTMPRYLPFEALFGAHVNGPDEP